MGPRKRPREGQGCAYGDHPNSTAPNLQSQSNDGFLQVRQEGLSHGMLSKSKEKNKCGPRNAACTC